jgi:hypothetical protein
MRGPATTIIRRSGTSAFACGNAAATRNVDRKLDIRSRDALVKALEGAR